LLPVSIHRFEPLTNRDHRFLNQKNTLACQFESLPAFHIAAGQQVIDADHVRPRFLEVFAVLIVCAAGNLRLLGAHHPPYRVGILLTAVRAGELHLLGFFFFIIEALFVHAHSLSLFAKTVQGGQTWPDRVREPSFPALGLGFASLSGSIAAFRANFMPAATVEKASAQARLPEALRWGALLWMAIWFPAYWHAWGLANFLHLCDLAVFLTCIGLWTHNRLLLSSQAISALLVDLAWTIDAAWTVTAKRQLIGGTEYLLDGHVALWIRALSAFHVLLPALLLWVLGRIGYDRRAWLLQCAIALAAFIASRFTNPLTNINYAFRDPFWHRTLGPAPVHVTLSVIFMAIVVYLPTHLLLLCWWPRGLERTSSQSEP
jgi:hypothetical protein